MTQLDMVCAVAEECFRWYGTAPYIVASSHPDREAFQFIEPRRAVLQFAELPLGAIAAEVSRDHSVHWGVCFTGVNYDLQRLAVPMLEGLYMQARGGELLGWWYCDGIAVIERQP